MLERSTKTHVIWCVLGHIEDEAQELVGLPWDNSCATNNKGKWCLIACYPLVGISYLGTKTKLLTSTRQLTCEPRYHSTNQTYQIIHTPFSFYIHTIFILSLQHTFHKSCHKNRPLFLFSALSYSLPLLLYHQPLG